MKDHLMSFIVGLVFSLGLGLSGMTLPSKVVSFLDFTGQWDPSLAFVMIGAIAVYFVLFRLILKRPTPIFGGKFSVPTRKDIDGRLLSGAALFGLGWGLAGFCPGPAIASVVSGATPVLVFVGAMLGGMALFSWADRRLAAKPAGASAAQPTPKAADKNASIPGGSATSTL